MPISVSAVVPIAFFSIMMLRQRGACERSTVQAHACLSAILITTPAVAQIAGSGTIKGIVTDATGAVVPGASVTATNVATGLETARVATDAGLYVIAPLAAGTYRLTASAMGFRPLVQEQVVVDALTTVEMDLKLEVGATSESVIFRPLLWS